MTWSDFALIAMLRPWGSGSSRCSIAGWSPWHWTRARVSGPIGLLNVALAALAGVTVAVSMRIVGILLIAALMVAGHRQGRIGTSIRSTMLLSMGIGLCLFRSD